MSTSNFPRQYYQTFGMSDDDSSSSEISSRRSSSDVETAVPSDTPASTLELSSPGSDSEDTDDTDEHIQHEVIESPNKGGILLEQSLFFLAGLGSSIGYISTLSSLVYFKILYGANSFVYLNCAVFLPLLPISLAQVTWDAHYDLLYQSRVTFLFRGIVGYAFIISGTVGIIFFAKGCRGMPIEDDYDYHSHVGELWWVIVHALQQGIGGAILFGQLNQMASFVQNQITTDHIFDSGGTNQFDENEALQKKFKATVSAGVQASALVVLVASIFSGFGTMNGNYFDIFMGWILLVEIICFLAILWLLLGRPRIRVSMLRRDSAMRELTRFSSDLEEFNELLPSLESCDNPLSDCIADDSEHDRMRLPLLQTPPSPDGSGGGGGEQTTMLTLKQMLYHSRLACLGLVLTLVPSFLVGSWFTRVETDWVELAQVLFYVRIGSDLMGRFATILVPPSSLRFAVWVAGLRIVAVVVFFANASSKIPLLDTWDRDALSIGTVALVAFFSGYLVTAFYQLAPQQLPGTPRVRAANAAKQSSLLTVAFSVSAIGGLVASFILIAAGF